MYDFSGHHHRIFVLFPELRPHFHSPLAVCRARDDVTHVRSGVSSHRSLAVASVSLCHDDDDDVDWIPWWKND